MEFTDRYQALGIPYPNPETVCLGHCEGTGMIPIFLGRERSEIFKKLWQEAHLKIHTPIGRLKSFIKGIFTLDKIWLHMTFEKCDGYHFIKCPDCNGTGKRR